MIYKYEEIKWTISIKMEWVVSLYWVTASPLLCHFLPSFWRRLPYHRWRHFWIKPMLSRFFVVNNYTQKLSFWNLLTETWFHGRKLKICDCTPNASCPISITAWKVFEYGVFSGPYFPAFGLNTEKYEVSLRIQSECGKARTRKNSAFGHFSRSVF